jgi:hypothetical protein
MFDASPEPEIAPDALPPAPVRAEERMRLTRRMAEMGARLGEILTQRAESAATLLEIDGVAGSAVEVHTHKLEESVRLFAQVSRAVCVAVALEERIDQDLQAIPEPTEAEQARERRRLSAVARRDEASRRRDLVAHAVEAVASTEVPEPGLTPRRTADLRLRIDRLLAPELSDLDRFLRRPEGEIIARICRDLGLKPDWTLWTDPWADEAMVASAALGNLRRQHREKTKENPSPSMGASERSPQASDRQRFVDRSGEGEGRGCAHAGDDEFHERVDASPEHRRRGPGSHPHPRPPIAAEGGRQALTAVVPPELPP